MKRNESKNFGGEMEKNENKNFGCEIEMSEIKILAVGNNEAK